jgi:integrase/recombinase XerD
VDNYCQMLLIRFSHWLVAWGAATSTIEARTCVLKAAIRDLGDPLMVGDSEIAAWLARAEWSQWTRATYFAHLRSFFGWLYETGERPDDPMVRMRAPKSPKSLPRPLSDAEVIRALTAAVGHTRAWLQLGLLAGLRVHEIAKIRGEDIIAGTQIYVLGKGSKPAVLPLHPNLQELAGRYPGSGFWFPARDRPGEPISGASITTTTTRLFRKIDIEGSHHRCRHTYGTNLLRNGANIRVVQQLLRHESLTSTQIYTEVQDSEQEAAIAGLGAKWYAAA